MKSNTTVTLNVNHYFDNMVSRRLWCKTSAISTVIPYILEDMFPDMNTLHLEAGMVCMQDGEDRRWKVWTSRSNIFDVAPSYTRGCKRDKDNLDIELDVVNKFDGFIFVTLLPEYVFKIRFVLSKDLVCNEKGVVIFE